MKKRLVILNFILLIFIIFSSFNVYEEEYLSKNKTYAIEEYHDLTFIGTDGGLYILDKDEKQIVPPADGNYSTLSPLCSYLNQLII